MKSEINNKSLIKGISCALGCETLYGLSYVFTRKATMAASPLYLLGWRFFIAFIVMSLLIITGLIKTDFKGKDLKPLFVVALFSPVIYFTGETVGIMNTTASESGVFLACIPVASLIASTVILKKKPSGLQVTGIVVTLIGVFITVFALGLTSSLSLKGYLFLSISVISYALYSVFVEKAVTFSGIEITYFMITSGAIVFSVSAVINALISDDLSGLTAIPFRNSDFMISVLYQGIGSSVLAFFMSNVAIAEIGVNMTSSFIGISTVVSILTGILILNEKFNSFQIIGAVIIIAGVYIANSGHKSEDG